MDNMNLQYVEKLSLREQFQLIKIAHETSDRELKHLAISTLQRYLNPPVFISELAHQQS